MKKIFITFLIVLTLLLTFTISSFALSIKDSSGEDIVYYSQIKEVQSFEPVFEGSGGGLVQLIVPKDYNISFDNCEILSIRTSDNTNINGSYFTSIFKVKIVDYIIEHRVELENEYSVSIPFNASGFYNFLSSHNVLGEQYGVVYLSSSYSGPSDYQFDESYYLYDIEDNALHITNCFSFEDFSNEYSYYIESYALKDNINSKDVQIENMSGLLNSMDQTLYEQNSTIKTIQDENSILKANLEYSQNQVATLSQSRGELMAVNASLEKQLQNKINLAYAQGLVDSGSTSNVVPILIGIITLLEGVALAFFIVSKIKNRKKGR